MNTLAIDEIYQAAREVLSHKDPEIELSDGTRVPVPELVPKMQAVVMWLHRNGFAVYLLTATNQWAAEVVAADWFGITADHVLGVKTDGEHLVTGRICRPAPIAEGKARVWTDLFKESRPLVGGGDSTGDYAILDLVEKSGVVLWTGRPDERPKGSHLIQVDITPPAQESAPSVRPATAGA